MSTHSDHVPACPCQRSDHDSDDDQPKKPVPEWAKGNQLRAQLVAQVCSRWQGSGSAGWAVWALLTAGMPGLLLPFSALPG